MTETNADEKVPSLSALIDELARRGVLTVKGEPIDSGALKKELKGKNVAVSFGFAKCQGLCPYINDKHAVLEKAAQDKSKFVSIVIDVAPDLDNQNNKTRQAYVDDVINKGSRQHDVKGFFPKTVDDADELQGFMTLFTVGGGAHSGVITLYDKEGQYVSSKDAEHEDAQAFRKWGEEHLNKPARQPEKSSSILQHPAVIKAGQALAAHVMEDNTAACPAASGKKHGRIARTSI